MSNSLFRRLSDNGRSVLGSAFKERQMPKQSAPRQTGRLVAAKAAVEPTDTHRLFPSREVAIADIRRLVEESGNNYRVVVTAPNRLSGGKVMIHFHEVFF